MTKSLLTAVRDL